MSDTPVSAVQNGTRRMSYDALRSKLDLRRRIAAAVFAVLFHLLIALGFFIADKIRIREIGEWTGPVLVKIGLPDAPESLRPDPGPLPESTIQEEVADMEPATQDTPQPEAAAPSPPSPENTDSVDAASRPVPADNAASAAENITQPPDTSQPAAKPASAPQPSRVRGNEQGNSYEINFEGSEDEVGRAAAYDYITSYMPLPEVLDASLVNGAKDYLGMSGASIRGELERYWEPVFGEYVKKKGNAGIVPLADRPYFWSLLVNSLNYNTGDADWRAAGMRPVVVEFSVGRSQGSSGAQLSDFKMISRTNDPRVDEAVIYGLSRWVYFNNSGKTVRGRITYSFDQ